MKIRQFAALIAVCVGLGGLAADEAFAKGGGGGGGNRGGGNRGSGIRVTTSSGGGIRINGGGSGNHQVQSGGGSHHVKHAGCAPKPCHPKPCHHIPHYCPRFYVHPVIVAGGPPSVPASVQSTAIPVGAVLEIPGYWGKYDGQVIVEFAGAQHFAKIVKWSEKGVLVEIPTLKVLVPTPAKLLVVRWDKWAFPPMPIKLVPPGTVPSGPVGPGVTGSAIAGNGSAPVGVSAAGSSAAGAAATGAAATGAAATSAAATGAVATVATNDSNVPAGTFDESIPDEIKQK